MSRTSKRSPPVRHQHPAAAAQRLGTTQFKLFLDGLCVAVNPSNSSAVCPSRTKDIFTGVDTAWNQVGGSNLSTTIDPVGRNSSAGSYTFFQQAVLGGATQSSNVHPVTSDGLVATAIHSDPNAIGYVGLAHSGTSSGVRTVSLNGVACNARTSRTRAIRCSGSSGAWCRR